ncbi:MAG: GPW/gp25 family protein [Bryobacteraceae bacterium]
MSISGKRPFLGAGWQFPVEPAPDRGGRVATLDEEALIDQSIRIILATNPGERVMRPTFGAGLRAFVFEPMSAATLAALRRRVEEALIDWEPRIEVRSVTVTALPNLGRVDIDCAYRVRSTNAHRNLVYPFYLEEGTRR